MGEIRIWQSRGDHDELVWNAEYPSGACSTSGEDARDWVLQNARKSMALNGINPDDYPVVYGHYEKVWVSHA